MGGYKLFDENGCLRLPDDIILLLFEYLSVKDCFAFSLSGVCDRFAWLFGQRRKLSISKCYQVTQNTFSAFSDRWLAHEAITVLDVSSCYWLSTDFLVETLSRFPHLEELFAHDTKLTLVDLAKIFKSCQKVTRLSISVVEASWQDVKHEIESNSLACQTLVISFQHLTYLKLVTLNAAYYIDSWLIILRIMGWCHSCKDLHIEVAYTEDYFSYGPYGREDYDEAVVEHARLNLFPYLDWMACLKSLIILKRGCGMSTNYPDECIKELLKWIFPRYGMRELERLWIQESDVHQVLSRNEIAMPSLKSLLLGSQLRFEVDEDQFRQLQHLGGVGFSDLTRLPEIRYVRGYCIDNNGVNEFCQSHPKLEHLHLNDNNGHPFTLSSNLRLESLKTLVYTCSYPHEDIMERLAEACPNVEALHIGYSNRSAIDPWTSITGADFMKVFRFEKLTTLSFNAFDLFDGSFFCSVFTGCSQLRTLHICGGMDRTNCFDNLCSALPLARKLRDFRMHFADYEENSSNLVLSILKVLTECEMLERLVFYEEEGCQSAWEGEPFEDAVVKFATAMKYLVALCFVTPMLLDRTTVDDVVAALNHHVLPQRPAFWFHFGSSLPRANDPSVPRVHYDEIVCPVNYYDMAPDF